MVDVSVSLGPRSYHILVGAGLLGAVGLELRRLGLGRKVVVFTDAGIQDLFGRTVVDSLRDAGFESEVVLLPAGEAAKSLDVAREAWDRLLVEGCDRGSTVLALGGGAVGDLAGFVAATYMRGMNLVQVPTTLLAQVDASSGGKTAIDHPRAKNLVGAFHQPRLVVVDPSTLLTLPEREFRAGLAEVIKHGIVLDAGYFDELEQHREAVVRRDLDILERVVAGSCRLKASIVERDEREAELRHVLNYGHTVGHALEAATRYERYVHGEAVSLGIVAEARIAERLGIATRETTTRQVDLLHRVGLPVNGLGAEPDVVVQAMTRDKKARDGRLPFVLAPAIGSFRLVYDVPASVVLETLTELAHAG
jgi:3-dehydroquinate synthase